MLAAILINNNNRPRDTHDPGWITTDSIRRKRWDGTYEEPLTPQQIEDTRRKHIEDAYNRLIQIPAAAAAIREVITHEQPDFRVLVRNQQVTELLMALYLEYLDEEDILLMYASLL